MILEKVEQLLVFEQNECVGWIARSMITRVQEALRHPGPDGKAPTAITQPIWQDNRRNPDASKIVGGDVLYGFHR
jgi:hypothetical protein